MCPTVSNFGAGKWSSDSSGLLLSDTAYARIDSSQLLWGSRSWPGFDDWGFKELSVEGLAVLNASRRPANWDYLHDHPAPAVRAVAGWFESEPLDARRVGAGARRFTAVSTKCTHRVFCSSLIGMPSSARSSMSSCGSRPSVVR